MVFSERLFSSELGSRTEEMFAVNRLLSSLTTPESSFIILTSMLFQLSWFIGIKVVKSGFPNSTLKQAKQDLFLV